MNLSNHVFPIKNYVQSHLSHQELCVVEAMNISALQVIDTRRSNILGWSLQHPIRNTILMFFRHPFCWCGTRNISSHSWWKGRGSDSIHIRHSWTMSRNKNLESGECSQISTINMTSRDVFSINMTRTDFFLLGRVLNQHDKRPENIRLGTCSSSTWQDTNIYAEYQLLGQIPEQYLKSRSKLEKFLDGAARSTWIRIRVMTL